MNPKRKRIVALLLLAVMLITLVSSVAAATDESAAAAPEPEETAAPVSEEPTSEPPELPSPGPSEDADPSEAPEGDQPEESPPIEEASGDDDVPRSDDGETLTRAEELFSANDAPAVNGPRRAKAKAAAAGDPTSGNMTKSTCVDFAEYESPTWYCNRYYTEGSHVYGHYFYASTIAYHTIDGVWAYCVEPNTSSLANQPYKSYRADDASSTSYWMRELDSTQRKNIQMILAFGYPERDYGYGQQAQYAATQTLIWEVCCKLRYSDVKSSDSYSLYYKVKAAIGNDYANAYDAIVNAISFSDGTVPSFAASTESSAPTVKLTLNTSTNCYEASVSDSKSVLSHFTFAYSGVTFTKSGSTLKISVPASSATSVKGKVVTGTSDQKVLSSSNPLVWENAYYQTVTTAGGADNLLAYFKLDWEDNGGIKLVKKTTDSSIGVSGWTFYFKPATGDTIFNRIIRNRKLGKRTWVFIDEIYLLFQHEYSANFLFTLWKRVRKYGACVTGITQNLEDMLQSHTARTMLANSEFLIMLNQAATDRMELARLLNISDNQLSYITNVESGRGLMRCGSAIVPFEDQFPKDTQLYRLMSTRPNENLS